MENSKQIRSALIRVVQTGTPALSNFAAWMLDHLPEVAFSSIRGLATSAGVNANTVTRLASELGYDGYDAFRQDVQALMKSPQNYSDRARALHNKSGDDIWSETLQANWMNMQTLFSPEAQATLESCIDPLLSARRVYTLGVRSCFSVAHYFSYAGSMAFDNFEQVPSMPGAILDQMATCNANDIVVAVSYEHYSSEVVRAVQIARENGARILALTDSYQSPISKDAWKIIRLPMIGPQLMPSLTTAFITAELLLTVMIARSPESSAKVENFENMITSHGGYVQI